MLTLRHYSLDELKAIREAEIENGFEDAAELLQGIIDTREADLHAKEAEDE